MPVVLTSVFSEDVASTTTGTRYSGVLSVDAGDLLICWTAEADGATNKTFTPSNDGAALTWTKRVDAYPGASKSQIEAWTAPCPTSRTVTVSTPDPTKSRAWGVIQVKGHAETTWGGQGVAPGSTDNTTPYTWGGSTLTTSAAGSCVICFWSDWQANQSMAGRTQEPSDATELLFRGFIPKYSMGINFKTYPVSGTVTSHGVAAGTTTPLVTGALLEIRADGTSGFTPPRPVSTTTRRRRP